MSRAKHGGRQCFLSLEKAAFRLGESLIFENTSWVWNRGEQWAVVGGNGSGKTLLADALRGRLPVVQGDLTFHFSPPSGLSLEQVIGHVAFESRKSVVRDTVVQSRWNSIEDEETLHVRDYLSYDRVMEINPFEVSPVRAKSRSAFERRCQQAVRLLHLQPFLDRGLLSLSNGENQRVQLARALCLPLRLLILDEPFTGLDGETRRQFSLLLGRLMRQALPVMPVTTRVEDLPPAVTHLLWVDRCRVRAAGARGWVEQQMALGRASLRAHPRKDGVGAQPGGARRAAAAPKPTPVSGKRTPSGIPLVELHQVTVRYGQVTVLDRVDWTVRAGESWALLGHNGSGKTTLLSLILGDNPQAYGNDVTVFGLRRGQGESIWDLKRRIGWVSPELQLHFAESATCFEVVASGFRDTIGLFEPPTARQRAVVRQWMERFGLLPLAGVSLSGLSAGEQRMALLARAVVRQPELLVLDEPCQGLDETHGRFFVRTVDELLRQEGVTAIYVTHRPEEIPASIERVLRLRKGRAKVEPGVQRFLRVRKINGPR